MIFVICKQRFPFVGLLFASFLGILLAYAFGNILYLLISLIVILISLFPFFDSGGIAWLIVILLFSGLHYFNSIDYPGKMFSDWILKQPICWKLKGEIIEEPKINSSHYSLLVVRLKLVEGLYKKELISKFPAIIILKWFGTIPNYGDEIECSAYVKPIESISNPGQFDNKNWLVQHHIYIKMVTDPSYPGKILSHKHSYLMNKVIQIRKKIENILEQDIQQSDQILSVIKGITLGIHDSSEEILNNDFKFTGTMHLFAVSGLHVGMVTLILLFFFKTFRIPYSVSSIITIFFIIIYVLITGCKAGSIRSASMISLFLIGSILYKFSPPLNTLAATAFIQLAINTNTIFSPGWQFSYMTVSSILIFVPIIEKFFLNLFLPDSFIPKKIFTIIENYHFKIGKHIATALSISLVSWIGSIILTAIYFHLFSISAISANLIAVPLAFLLLCVSFLSIFFGIFSLKLAILLNNSNWLIAQLIITSIHLNANIPYTHWFFRFFQKHQITFLSVSNNPVIVIAENSAFSLINIGNQLTLKTILIPFLESQGVNRIQSIIFTKNSKLNLGCLAKLSTEFPIDEVVFPEKISHNHLSKELISLLAHIKFISCNESIKFSKKMEVHLIYSSSSRKIICIKIKIFDIKILYLSNLSPSNLAEINSLSATMMNPNIIYMNLYQNNMVKLLEMIHHLHPQFIITPPKDIFHDNDLDWNSLLKHENIRLLDQNTEGAITLYLDHPSYLIGLKKHNKYLLLK